MVEETDERLSVARVRDVAVEPDDDMLRTHDLVAVRDYGGETGWGPDRWTSCTPQLVLDDVAAADVWLDGEPDPVASELDLLVMEMSCAGGASAEGRVELVTLDEGDEVVEVVVGVRPRRGASSCPGNPATPFTIELQQPLGDRALIDGSVFPSRPLEAAPSGLQRG